MPEFLMIGGPADGKRLNLPDNPSVVLPDERFENPLRDVVRYTRRRFSDGSQMFVDESITDDEIMLKLIENYRPSLMKRINKLEEQLDDARNASIERSEWD